LTSITNKTGNCYQTHREFIPGHLIVSWIGEIHDLIVDHGIQALTDNGISQLFQFPDMPEIAGRNISSHGIHMQMP